MQVHSTVLSKHSMFVIETNICHRNYVILRLFLDLDWELVYVGSGESNAYDQILDSILVGPVVEGRHKFIFEVFYFWTM